MLARRAGGRARGGPRSTELAEDGAVGPGEVHQLEDAAADRSCGAGGASVSTCPSTMRTNSPGCSSRISVAPIRSKRAGLRGDDDAVAQARRARGDGSRVDRRPRRSSRPDADHQAVGTLGAARAPRGSGPPWSTASERAMRCTRHLGVGRGGEDGALARPARAGVPAALVRLPLWATDRAPQRVLAKQGCALARTVLPAVE